MTTHQGYRIIISNPDKPKIDRVMTDEKRERNKRRQAIEAHRERLDLKEELKDGWEC